MVGDWSIRSLTFGVFKSRGELLLKGDDISEIIGLMEDSLMVLNSLMSNRYMYIRNILLLHIYIPIRMYYIICIPIQYLLYYYYTVCIPIHTYMEYIASIFGVIIVYVAEHWSNTTVLCSISSNCFFHVLPLCDVCM